MFESSGLVFQSSQIQITEVATPTLYDISSTPHLQNRKMIYTLYTGVALETAFMFSTNQTLHRMQEPTDYYEILAQMPNN